MLYRLVINAAYLTCGVALSRLNNSEVCTLKRPSAWVILGCLLTVQLATRFLI